MPELLSDPLVQIALGVSLIFGLGLALAFPFSKAPAKAHAILVLALSGSLVFPFFYMTVHRADWGLLPSLSPSPVGKVSNTNQDLVSQITSPNKTSPLLENRSDQSAILDQAQIPLQDDPIASDSPSLCPGFLESVFTGARNLLNSLQTSQKLIVFALLTILYWGWGLWTVFSLFLLARTVWATYRLAKTGSPLEEGSGLFLKELAGKIGLSQVPCLLENSTVRTPAVLGMHRVWATILIPKGVAPHHYSNGVFFHELAHLKRNDPLWNLLARFATAVFPWNPLAYALRKNIHRYAEMACDDWAVECGTEPEKYVHELLSLIDPESPLFPALLSVASGFNELSQRLTRLKTGETASPHLQKTWVLAWTMVLPCLMVLSFLQPGSNPVHASELKSARPGNSPLEPAQDNPQIFHSAHSITVLQVRSGGKPSPRTKVWMEILDQDQYLFLGPNLTDENGLVSFAVNSAKIQSAFALDDNAFQAWKPWVPGPKSAADLQVDLERPAKTKIQLLQEGKPLSGTRVELVGFDPHRLFDKYQQLPRGFPKASGTSDANGLVELEPIIANGQIGVRIAGEWNNCFQIQANPESVATIHLNKPGALEIRFSGKGQSPLLEQLSWEILGENPGNKKIGIPIQDHNTGSHNSNVSGNQIRNIVPGSYSLSFLHLPNTPFVLGNKGGIVIKSGQVTTIDLEYSKAASLRGRLVDAKTRKGIPGLFLAVQKFKGNQPDPIQQEIIQSDAEGKFHCYVEGGYQYTVSFLNHLHDSDRYQIKAAQDLISELKLPLKPFAEEELFIPDIALTPSAKIQGIIRNAGPMPVDKVLQVYCPVMPSQNLDFMANFNVFDSHLEVLGVRETPLKIWARQGNAVNTPVALSPGQWAQKPHIDLRQENGIDLSGFIQNQQGTPIAKAKVSLFWLYKTQSVTNRVFSQCLMESVHTAEDGSFQFSGYWAGERYYIAVESSGFLPVMDNLNPKLSGMPGTTLDFGTKKLVPIPNQQKPGD